MPIEPYLQNQFGTAKKSIAQLSCNEQGKSLVDANASMYCFDDITTCIHGTTAPPASVDAIITQGKAIYLLEFKGGFHRKITKENFDPQKAECEHTKGVTCKHLEGFIFKTANHERAILLDSLKMKALESYNTLEKCILLENGVERDEIYIEIVYILDASDTDLLMPANDAASDLGSVKDALARFAHKKDAAQKKYLYDKVTVLPHQAFLTLVESGKIPSLP